MPTTRTVSRKTTAKKTTAPVPSRTKRTIAKASSVQLEEEVPQKTARTRKSASPVPRKSAAKTPAKKTAAPVKKIRSIPQVNPNLYNPDTDANKKLQGMSYQQISDRVGIRIGSEQFIAVIELLKGAGTRQEINERVRELLPPTTINGTTKQVTNMVSAVLHRMMDLGFQVDGKYRLVLAKGTSSK